MNDKIAKLLISYLWRLIRETQSSSETKDGRARLGERDETMKIHFEYLQNLINKSKCLLKSKTSNDIEAFVNNNLHHYFNKSSLPSKEIHEKMVEEMKDYTNNNRAKDKISEKMRSTFKDVLYSYYFDEERLSIQEEVFKRAKNILDEKEKELFPITDAASWLRHRDDFTTSDEEIDIIFERLTDKNLKYLIARRYLEGFPVFLLSNLPGYDTDALIPGYLERNIGEYEDLLKSIPEIKKGYETFIDRLKELKIYNKKCTIRKDTLENKIEHLKKEKKELKNSKQELWNVDIRKIDNIPTEKEKINKKTQEKEDEINKLEKRVNYISIIKQHIKENKNINDIDGSNDIKSDLGFYSSRKMETENWFDRILDSLKIDYERHDRRTLQSVQNGNNLEIDRILIVNDQKINIEISDPQHFGGVKYIIDRDTNKINSILKQELFPFIFISYDCLYNFEKNPEKFKKLLLDYAQQSEKKKAVIEIHNGRSLKKHIKNNNFLSFKIDT